MVQADEGLNLVKCFIGSSSQKGSDATATSQSKTHAAIPTTITAAAESALVAGKRLFMDSQTRKMMEEFHHQPPTLLHDHANMPNEPGSREPQPKSGLVGGVQRTTGPTSANATSTMPYRNCFVCAAVAESALVAGKRFFTVSQTRKMIDKFHHQPPDLPNECQH